MLIESPEVITRLAYDTLLNYLTVFPQDTDRLGYARKQLSEANPNLLMRSTMEGHITTSGLVFDPESRKVLIIHHRVYDAWYVAGGHYELPGTLRESAAREVLEETGVLVQSHPWQLDKDIPFDIDTHPIGANPAKSEGDHVHHDFTYLFTASSQTPLTPQAEEVFGAKWVSVEEYADNPEDRTNRLGKRLIQFLAGQSLL